MSPRRTIVLAAVVILLPLTASAMWSTVWDVRGGQVQGGWQSTGSLSAQATAEGLRVQASDESAIYRPVRFDQRVDALRLTAVTPVDTKMRFIWEKEGGDGSMIELPFVLHALGGPHVVDIELSKYPQWTGNTAAVGFALPPGGDILIQTIEFRGWNIIERLEDALLGTWRFDTFRAYSINFLWGPRVAYNPVGREQMFMFLPPFAKSANWVLYDILGMLLLAVGCAQLLRMRADIQRRLRTVFLAGIASAWLLYDARMSAEILSYAKTDLEQHVLATPEERSFRLMQDFWDVLDAARPSLEGSPTIVFVGPDGVPFFPYVRYELYPSTVQKVDDERNGPATWFFYRQSNITWGLDGRLMREGVALTLPGDIVLTLSGDSFIFRERP